MVNLQDRTAIVTNPVEIDSACEAIRQLLSGLPWISHPFHIAQRFYRKEGQKTFYYPETYVRDANTPDGKFPYHRLTPDGDYDGMFFFYVGDGADDYENGKYNFLTWPTAIIFSANLERIDDLALPGLPTLATDLYTQQLIRDSRRLLTDGLYGQDFQIRIRRESRDLRTVYREFSLDEIEQYNRLPIQCWRFDIEIILQEECLSP